MRKATDRRSWHRGLDRDAVVSAALELLDREGREALTMRALAHALEVEAPSLYAHVASKDALVDAVLDRVLESVVVPPANRGPRESLIDALGSYRATLLRHRWVVELIPQRSRLSGQQVRLVSHSITLLESAGLSLRAAVDTHVTLVAFVLGFVLQEVGRSASPPPGMDLGPVLGRVLPTLAARPVDERFAVGLGLILDGAGVERAS